MVSEWLPTAFKVAIAVGLGVALWHFLPNTMTTAITNTVNNQLTQLP